MIIIINLFEEFIVFVPIYIYAKIIYCYSYASKFISSFEYFKDYL